MKAFAMVTIVTVIAAVAVGGCSDDSSSSVTTTPDESTSITTTSSTTTSSTTSSAATTTSAAATSSTTSIGTTSTSTTTSTTTSTVPGDALQTLPGVALMDVTIAGSDPTRPTFAWAAPAGAVTFQVAVQTIDGVPIWGWTGSATETVLGGVARPPDVEGPTLTGESRVRVDAFDSGHVLIGVTPWTPIATG